MTENSCRENMHALPWWQPLTHEEAERFFGLGTPRRRSSYRADLPAFAKQGPLSKGSVNSLRPKAKKIKGLHENDFIMATKIDQIFDRSTKSPSR